MSPIAKIENLRFYAMPRGQQIIDVDKVASHGDTTIYQDKKGKLYSLGVRSSGTHSFGRGVCDGYLHCAVALGVITRAEANEHFQLALASDNRRDKRDRAKQFKELAAMLSIKLTAVQDRKLEALRK